MPALLPRTPSSEKPLPSPPAPASPRRRKLAVLRVHGLADVPCLNIPPSGDLQQLWGRGQNPPEPPVRGSAWLFCSDTLRGVKAAGASPAKQLAPRNRRAGSRGCHCGRRGSPPPQPHPAGAQPSTHHHGVLRAPKLVSTRWLQAAGQSWPALPQPGKASETCPRLQLGISSCAQTPMQCAFPGAPSH